MSLLDPGVVAALTAAVERVIPSDDGRAGAREAGTIAHVLERATVAGPDALAALAGGAAALDRAALASRSAVPFAHLDQAEQNAVLVDFDAAGSPFLAALVESTMEGFYGDPRHGGNRDALSWGLIRFPGPTAGAGYQSPLGAYDAVEPVLPGLDDAR